MGFALTWLAIKGKPAEVVLDELELRPTGVRVANGELPLAGAVAAAGWYLIVADGAELQPARSGCRFRRTPFDVVAESESNHTTHEGELP